MGAFLQGLQQTGWSIGRNLHVDYRWSAGDAAVLRRQAVELVALAPDVILATGSPPLQQLQQATSNVPIVFVQVADAVGAGFIESIAPWR